jgi:asparagine synthase (glutamine-hydrolysing)
VDRRHGGVLLARDHVGARPLVMHERPGVVAFASAALALTGLDGVGHALDVRRTAQVLALVFDSDRTFVHGVHWVPPATALWVDDSGLRRWTWWRPEPHEISDAPPAAHERALRDALEVSVGARLRTTGTVGAMISGGLDSTSVAATAGRRLAPRPLPTYTAAPPPGWSGAERPNWDADESPLVRKLAALHPNMAPSFVHVAHGGSLFARHEALWELGAVPPRNPCNWLWYHEIGLRAQAHGVTALLTGIRGNLYFSADGPEWVAALLRRGRLAAALREAKTWSGLAGQGRYRTLRSHVISPLLPARARRLVRAARRRPTPVDEWNAQSSLRPDLAPELELAKLLPMLDERRRPDRWQVALSELRTVAGQVEATAAMAALTGVEERDPTGDRRVIETAIGQPEWIRRRDGIGRAVARGAMADRLPPEIVQRTQRGEQLPDWLDVMTAARAELEFELNELNEHPTSRQLIDIERLRRLMERWPNRAACTDRTAVRDYRIVLLRALLISRYLRWFEERAAAPPRRSGRPVSANA